jgi:hypothetical protein
VAAPSVLYTVRSGSGPFVAGSGISETLIVAHAGVWCREVGEGWDKMRQGGLGLGNLDLVFVWLKR